MQGDLRVQVAHFPRRRPPVPSSYRIAGFWQVQRYPTPARAGGTPAAAPIQLPVGSSRSGVTTIPPRGTTPSRSTLCPPRSGGFRPAGGALKAGQARREIEQAESARRGILQLTPQVFERRLEALVEKLQSGATGRVREAIRASGEKILVGEDGARILEVKPEGLLGTQTAMATSGCRETGPILERAIQAGIDGQWKVYGAGQGTGGPDPPADQWIRLGAAGRGN